jgi:hypothetical protein
MSKNFRRGQFFIISSAIVMIMIFSATSFLRGYNEINFEDVLVHHTLLFEDIVQNFEKIKNKFGVNSTEVKLYADSLEFFNRRGYIITVLIDECINVKMKTLDLELTRKIC